MVSGESTEEQLPSKAAMEKLLKGVASLAVLLSAIAITMCQVETQDTCARVSIEKGISSYRRTVTEGGNITFLCYMKTVEEIHNVLWTVRLQSDTLREIKDISAYTSHYSVEPIVCSHIDSRYPDNCTDAYGLFPYHCYRLSLFDVNATLNQSLISCGYKTEETLDSGLHITSETYYHNPFRLIVEKSVERTTSSISICPTTTKSLTSTVTVSTTITVSPSLIPTVTPTSTPCYTVESSSCDCTHNPTSASPSVASRPPTTTSTPTTANTPTTPTTPTTATTPTTEDGQTTSEPVNGVPQETVAASSSVLGAVIIALFAVWSLS